jgi:hypothetical protein
MDIAYWTSNPLEPQHVAVLRRIKAQEQRYVSDRFAVAYLIALGCVAAGADQTLSVTTKGEDALAFFAELQR